MRDKAITWARSRCTLFHAALIVSTLTLAAALPVYGSEVSTVNLTAVADKLQQAVDRELVRGAVVAAYDSGAVTYKGVGVTAKGSSDPPTKDTVFEIGSITKVFTALLVQTLVQEEELSWDSTLKESLPLPTLEFANNRVQEITLRELAIHSSGLPRLPANMQPSDLLDPYIDYSAEQLLSFVLDYDPETLDKTQVYSNLGFGLLGAIAAYGVDYDELMRSNIFEPLEMTNSYVEHTPENQQMLIPGYSRGATMPNWNFDVMVGAGGVLSTAEDLMKFVSRNIETSDSPIDKSLSNLREPQVAPNQGLGWALMHSDGGKPVYWHAGATGGYVSFLAISPEESKGWVILAASTESALINEMGVSFFRASQQSTGVDLSPYVGVFELSPNLNITFSDRDGQLFGQASGQQEFPLTHSDGRSFNFELGGISITFGEPSDENGQAQELEWSQRGHTISAKRIEDSQSVTYRKEIELSVETLEQYPGKYRLGDNFFLTILHREGQLFAHATGQPVFPIFALEEDRFFYKVVDAEIHFERDEDENIVALTLHQNGELRAPLVEE